MSLVLPLLAAAVGTSPVTEAPVLHPAISEKVVSWAALGRPDTLTDDRATDFAPLAAWIAEKKATGAPAHLVFVCTHNSRRSHMAQLWAQAAAVHKGLDQVRAWSGGTEATAFNPRAVQALKSHGMWVVDTGETKGDGNPVYNTKLGPKLPGIKGFSKTYDDPFNPQQGFAAVMVCSEADRSCPFVAGADIRVSIPYVDPKASDGTPDEEATYARKSSEIGHEMTWLMGEVAKRL